MICTQGQCKNWEGVKALGEFTSYSKGKRRVRYVKKRPAGFDWSGAAICPKCRKKQRDFARDKDGVRLVPLIVNVRDTY